MVDFSFVILHTAGPEYRVGSIEETDLLYRMLDDSGKWLPNSEYIHKNFDGAPVYETIPELLMKSKEFTENMGNNKPIIFLDNWQNTNYNSL